MQQLNSAKLNDVGVSENRLNPFLPNGFAGHYPVFKWLAIIGKINPTFSGPNPYIYIYIFHWEYTLFSDKPMLFFGTFETASDTSIFRRFADFFSAGAPSVTYATPNGIPCLKETSKRGSHFLQIHLRMIYWSSYMYIYILYNIYTHMIWYGTYDIILSSIYM